MTSDPPGFGYCESPDSKMKELGSSTFFVLKLYWKLLGVVLLVSAVVKFLFTSFNWGWITAARSRRQIQNPSPNLEKREFLKEFRDYYGYAGAIDELRRSEFSRLNGIIYLDHAGATLHSSSQVREALADYTVQLYGNPHSQSDSSIKASDMIAAARHQVLAHFGASPSDYACIFTSGATAALKLVGEAFPWTCDSQFFYTTENHNSVLGIREYALASGASAAAVDISEDGFINQRLLQRRKNVRLQAQENDGETFNLFAMPTECNFSGVKPSVELVNSIRKGVHKTRGQWMILLDAAKSAGTSPPDLSRYPADFLVTSFYKIFGYPTGLGALILRRDSAKVLQKAYFGGGTVAVSIADIDYVKRRENIEQHLEDGTVSFLSICALRYGFAFINKLGIDAIARHTWSLTHYTSSKLLDLKHANGAPVCRIYGNHGLLQKFAGEFQIQGPVIAFNLLRADGSWVGYREVEKLACLCHIHLRTGCFCNPGACAKYLSLSNKDLQSNYEAGHVCWDDRDLMSGRPTGAVRISFGYMSTFEDCQGFLHFVHKYFVEKSGHQHREKEPGKPERATMPRSIRLKSIIVYPIKSCAGFSVESWPVSDSGFLYDREWLVAGTGNVTLTQKKVPQLCLIKTYIDLASGKLLVRSLNVDHALEISLEEPPEPELAGGRGGRANSSAYGPKVAQWFTKALGVECTLIRKEAKNTQLCTWRPGENARGEATSSFANEGQFLLLSEKSLKDLNARAKFSSDFQQLDPVQFRPNLVISGAAPYEEDLWQMVCVGDIQLPVIGGCNRCKMITIDQRTGEMSKSAEPLATLASYRRTNGKILFGVLLGAPLNEKNEGWHLTVGSEVTVT